jgi:hypothetical protein
MTGRRQFKRKIISVTLVILFVYQIVCPTIVFALTGGPSQPEVDTFTPISSSDMVDLFTGDFKYNIPLMTVGDYPINLIYNSNPSMDQEASWVGLGWNINPGAMNRNMRGLPDDFKGDVIRKEFNMKDNKSWGVDLGAKVKVLGLPIPKNAPADSAGLFSLNMSFNVGVSSNNYRGYGVSLGISPAISASKASGGGLTGSLGMQVSSQDGTTISADAGIMRENAKNTLEAKVGSSYNTRTGLKELTLKASSQKNIHVSDYNHVQYEKGTNDEATGSVSGGASFSFGSPTFTPTINMPLDNTTFNLAGTIGGAFIGLHNNITISGYWSRQTLQSKVRELPAYGYMNSSQADNGSLLDFNREKDGPYNKSIPNLAIPNFTYDLFSATGEGIGGQFRAYRGDIGILYDNYTQSGSTSMDAGIQLGLGNLFHGGVNIQDVQVNTISKKWQDDNFLINSMDFVRTTPYVGYEKCYFKSPCEFTLADTTLFHKIGEEYPVRGGLLHGYPSIFSNTAVLQKFSLQGASSIGLLNASTPTYHEDRVRRAQYLSYFTSEEAEAAGLDKDILNFIPDSLPYRPGCDISCNGRFRIPYDHVGFNIIPRSSHPYHHISEMTVTKTDGKKYVYGVPAYNNIERDVTFACKDLPADVNGLVDYYPNVDNNKDHNSHGIDNYFTSEEIPGYAYSYLLSGILSPDYIDRTGNGITTDDNGEAIRFNYSRVNLNYHWRVPYEENYANYNPGLNASHGSSTSSVGDAKASYCYGTKELWYVHSIESKNMLAQFYLSDRLDGLGVVGENGGKNSNDKQKLLREIRLYSKTDLIKYGNDAIPVKTVHFVYDYSLCKGLPNTATGVYTNTAGEYDYYMPSSNVNEGGKLTLRKVYFTYGNNTRGQLNSYQFNYSAFNPNYGHKKFDRWGNYKDNAGVIPVENSDFPYTIQDKALADQFSTAWNLEEILLPSGGTIHVNLESDDYAYVQNKRAGQMFFINSFGFANGTTCTPQGNNLFGSPYANAVIINVGDNSNYRTRFLDGLNYIYYRTEVDIGNTSVYDYLSGYAEIDKSDNNWSGAINSDQIWVRVKLKTDEHVFPICAQGWQFLKNNYPEIAYPGSNDPGNDLGDALLGLISSMGEIIDNITGWESHAIQEHWSQYVNLSKSFVRLTNPDYC